MIQYKDMQMKLNESYTEYELWQDDMCVAASNDKSEIGRYAMQYVEDGPVEIYEVKKTLIATASKTSSVHKAC